MHDGEKKTIEEWFQDPEYMEATADLQKELREKYIARKKFEVWFSKVLKLNIERDLFAGVIVADQPLVHDSYARGDSPEQCLNLL